MKVPAAGNVGGGRRVDREGDVVLCADGVERTMTSAARQSSCERAESPLRAKMSAPAADGRLQLLLMELVERTVGGHGRGTRAYDG